MSFQSAFIRYLHLEIGSDSALLSVNISNYLTKRDYGLANYSSDSVCIDDLFGWKEKVAKGKCR